MSRPPVVLITGATSGFGLETARRLAQEGYRVYGTFRNPKKTGELKGVPSVIPVFLDVTRPASISKAVSAILKKEGRIDVLVNNAGFVMAGFLEDLSDRDLKDQLDTNVLGLLRMTRAVVPSMRRSGKGRIVNIGSISGRVVFPALGAYAASKFMVRSLSEGLRQELRPFGIEVAEIAPGSFNTGVVASSRFGKGTLSPRSPYRSFKAQVEKVVEKSFQQAAPARKVAELIAEILSGPRLKPVYLAGLDAKAMAFLKRRLPDAWVEWLLGLNFPWSRFPR